MLPSKLGSGSLKEDFQVRILKEDARFVPVVVSKYIGSYGKNSPTAWAVADRKKANSIVSDKFNSQKDAQAEADRMAQEAK